MVFISPIRGNPSFLNQIRLHHRRRRRRWRQYLNRNRIHHLCHLRPLAGLYVDVHESAEPVLRKSRATRCLARVNLLQHLERRLRRRQGSRLVWGICLQIGVQFFGADHLLQNTNSFPTPHSQQNKINRRPVLWSGSPFFPVLCISFCYFNLFYFINWVEYIYKFLFGFSLLNSFPDCKSNQP